MVFFNNTAEKQIGTYTPLVFCPNNKGAGVYKQPQPDISYFLFIT